MALILNTVVIFNRLWFVHQQQKSKYINFFRIDLPFDSEIYADHVKALVMVVNLFYV